MISFFLLFSMIQFRDGPFIRPHPAFWRVVLGVNVLYELGMVFLLFQDLDSARLMMKYLDPKLGVPLPEKSYAENCDFTATNIWVSIVDVFMSSSYPWTPFVECDRHFLFSTRSRLVWKSSYFTRLLVLLGKCLTVLLYNLF